MSLILDTPMIENLRSIEKWLNIQLMTELAQAIMYLSGFFLFENFK